MTSPQSFTWLRNVIASALALPLAGCFGDEEEGEACLAVPSDGICPSRSAANKILVGDACGYDILAVTGTGTIKNKYPEGGFLLASPRASAQSLAGTTTDSHSNSSSGTNESSSPGETSADETSSIPDGAMPMCCYPVLTREDRRDGCVPGRPFIVAQRLIVAPIVANAPLAASTTPDWHLASLNFCRPNDPEVCAKLGAYWLRVAQGEHASIAAFARLSLELLAFGAPAALIKGCQQAALDEVHHAQGAFAIASTYLGYCVGAGPLPLDSTLALASDLDEWILAAAREGCVNETSEVLLVQQAMQAVDDPELKIFLARVCDDESRHAALSWQIVAWGLQRAPHLRSAIAAILAPQRSDTTCDVEAFVTQPELELAANGYISPEVAQRIKKFGRDQVIRPLWQAFSATLFA